jgi:serine/threonine-protein kinase
LVQRVAAALSTEYDITGERRVSHYDLRRVLGRGGMGVVYEARDKMLDRLVALKILLPGLAADPIFELRFLREARAAARLSHPGLVTVYEAGRHRGKLYIAMELVRGKTLTEHQGSRIEPSQAVDIAAQAALAMEAAHAAKIIHRDLKPANIMLTPEGRVKILDFGLVRVNTPHHAPLTEAGTTMGTPAYAAPELIKGGVVDARGDIYSLGIVLYELLANDCAFEADHMFVLLARIAEGRLKKPVEEIEGIHPDLCRLVKSMIATEPAERPASMSLVAAELRRLQERSWVKI